MYVFVKFHSIVSASVTSCLFSEFTKLYHLNGKSSLRFTIRMAMGRLLSMISWRFCGTWLDSLYLSSRERFVSCQHFSCLNCLFCFWLSQNLFLFMQSIRKHKSGCSKRHCKLCLHCYQSMAYKFACLFLQQVLKDVLEEAGYSKDSLLVQSDFMKVIMHVHTLRQYNFEIKWLLQH